MASLSLEFAACLIDEAPPVVLSDGVTLWKPAGGHIPYLLISWKPALRGAGSARLTLIVLQDPSLWQRLL